MLPFRIAAVLVFGLCVGAQAQSMSASGGASSPLLDGLVAKVPGTKLSDGRGAIDRALPTADGPKMAEALVPAGLLLNAPMVLLGAKTLQAQDAGELVTWMKAKGRAVRIGHAGAWSASLECALQLQDVVETKLTLVASADVADALGKLRSGAVDLLCEAVPAVIDDVRSGQAIAFVLASDERLTALWDVATADQAGLPLFSMTAWVGLYAPSPEAIAAVQDALTDDIVQKLAEFGWSTFAKTHQTSEAHTQHLASEAERRKGRLTDAGLPAAP